MNYRHAYHAGNFADVVKHAVLARILTYMKLKPQPFRVIDTHAGIGLYDLEGEEAGKTAEWQDGIDRIVSAPLSDRVKALLAPYLEAVNSVNGPGALITHYPGSPLIARHLMRHEDHLVLNELHPEDCAALKAATNNFPSTKVLALDAWVAVKSLLPPKERRGIILIDPPFEAADEFDRVAEGLADGLRRFQTGIFVVWYPVKSQATADRFIDRLTRLPALKALDARLKICAPFPGLGLTEIGLFIVNPPYPLAGELEDLLPALASVLEQGAGFGSYIRQWGL
jgi:23S rRNA (adenine2030-N6)-methyltransferase